MTKLTKQIETLLTERVEQANLRKLASTTNISSTKIRIGSKELLNFASNDYLGLSQHPLLKERAIKAIEKYGIGNPSSRLICGNCDLYEEIETLLAKLKGTQTALVFPSGFQTNLTVLHALSKLNSFFFCDEYSHNSILLGVQLSNRKFKRFTHNDLIDLQTLLKKNTTGNNWIITESVFSMDGDLAPIADLEILSQTQQNYLYIDEAHATGVFGKNGMGLVNKPNENTMVMGTFGKGGGSYGAYIACTNHLRNYLINACPGLIYTTALPPSILASIQGALELIPHMVSERLTLLNNAKWLKDELNHLGFNTGQSNSQIICLILGESKLALSLSHYLAEKNIYAPAIRPPTVPANTARLRLSLSAAHTNLDIEYLLNCLKQWYANKH